MLTVNELVDELALFDYRPGWNLSIGVDWWEGPFLRVTATVANAFDPEKDVHLGITAYISPNDRATPGHFHRFLDWRLGRVASHEHREWLRYRGEALNDPHESGELHAV